MPRISKIAAGERRNWLERSEGGEAILRIAKSVGRDVRTVRQHIEKGRLERDFEVAQREQLRDALRAHQQDMLSLLKDLKDSVYVPELAYVEIVGLDFGLEDLWEPSDLARNRERILRPRPSTVENGPDDDESAASVKVIRDVNGPQDVQLTSESSRLGRALKEHIRQDPLWRHVATWRNALMEEFQRRAELNRAIRKKAEEVFGLAVSWRREPQEPCLSPGTIWWTRTRLTNIALGNYVPAVDEEIRETSPGSLETKYGQLLTQGLEEPKTHIEHIIAAMSGHGEVNAAAQSFNNLQAITTNVHNAIDEYLLIHHIPGRCSLCKKLGGQ